jgi:hypothetical protein
VGLRQWDRAYEFTQTAITIPASAISATQGDLQPMWPLRIGEFSWSTRPLFKRNGA